MKNGEGYPDPTAGKAIHKAMKQEKKRILRLNTMRHAGQRECLTYNAGCAKTVNGETKICPLKGDLRMCYGINASAEEIEAAYQKMFRKEK